MKNHVTPRCKIKQNSESTQRGSPKANAKADSVCALTRGCSERTADKEARAAEAKWTVRNASICPLQRSPDSCRENTSGHLIMQIPKVRWPLQPEGALSVITGPYTLRHAE